MLLDVFVRPLPLGRGIGVGGEGVRALHRELHFVLNALHPTLPQGGGF